MPMAPYLTHLLEFRLIHDADRGEVTVTVLAARGDEQYLITVEGRYGNSHDEPTVALDIYEAVVQGLGRGGFSADLLDRGLPGRRLKVDLGCDMQVVSVRHERLPRTDDDH